MNLFDTGKSSDVTLVCDDQVKFKAHKFILKSFSPVFETFLNESNDSKTVVYLRGVNPCDKTILLCTSGYKQPSYSVSIRWIIIAKVFQVSFLDVDN